MRISIDGGGGSLKVLASIFDKNEDSEVIFTQREQPGSRLTGVNRVILLAYVEDLQETWHNLRIVLELLQLDGLSYRLAADMKLINILLGISSHSGKYACFICYGESNLVAGPSCTYRHLKEMYAAYEAAGFPEKLMSQFYNVIRPCLINPDDLNIPIGDVIPPPQLHLHIGIVNWAWDLVKKMLGENQHNVLLNWSRTRSITVRGYQGTGLDGGNSKNFLKASKDLHIILAEKNAAPIKDMLHKFDLVTKACFSRDLLPDWRMILDSFVTSVWELVSFCKIELKIKLSITWKVHIMVCHVRPFLEKTNMGLADWSEQTGESAHHKVEVEMKRFRRDINNPLHGEKMLAGCSRFNSKRF